MMLRFAGWISNSHQMFITLMTCRWERGTFLPALIPTQAWGVMSNGDELPDFTQDYADAVYGGNTGPASECAPGGGGWTAGPVAATAPGAAATPALSFPALRQSTPRRRSAA